jgi:hypothetical protein
MNRDDFCWLTWRQMNRVSDINFPAIWSHKDFAMANCLNGKAIQEDATVLSHVTQPDA